MIAAAADTGACSDAARVVLIVNGVLRTMPVMSDDQR